MSHKGRPGGTPRWRHVSLILGAVIVGALVIVIAWPGRDVSEPDVSEPDVSEPDAAAPRRVAVVGNSNTEMDSPDFAAGRIGEDSWVSTVLAAGHRFEGGWAVAGSTSVQQAEGLDQIEGADALLIMTGTNDLAQGVDFAQTAASLEAIVTQAPAERVVLLAIPPRDRETTPMSSEFNQSLQDLAGDRGWEYFDGLEFLRSTHGGFLEGTTPDGVHLTPDAQEQFGEAVVEYLGPETPSG